MTLQSLFICFLMLLRFAQARRLNEQDQDVPSIDISVLPSFPYRWRAPPVQISSCSSMHRLNGGTDVMIRMDATKGTGQIEVTGRQVPLERVVISNNGRPLQTFFMEQDSFLYDVYLSNPEDLEPGSCIDAIVSQQQVSCCIDGTDGEPRPPPPPVTCRSMKFYEDGSAVLVVMDPRDDRLGFVTSIQAPDDSTQRDVDGTDFLVNGVSAQFRLDSQSFSVTGVRYALWSFAIDRPPHGSELCLSATSDDQEAKCCVYV